MSDDEARQDEEIIDEQIGVLDEVPAPLVAGHRHVEHDDQDGAHPAQGIERLETAMGDGSGFGQGVHGRVIAPVKLGR